MKINHYKFKRIPPQIKEVAERIYDAPRGFKGATCEYPAITVSQEYKMDYGDFKDDEYRMAATLYNETLIEFQMEMDVTEARELRKIAQLLILDPAIEFEGVTDLDYIYMLIEHAGQSYLRPLRIETETTARGAYINERERFYLKLTITMDMSGKEWRYDPGKGDIFVLH